MSMKVMYKEGTTIKINTYKRKIWDVKRAKKLLIIRTIRYKKIKEMRKQEKYFSSSSGNLLSRVNSSRNSILRNVKFRAPKIFSIENNRRETLDFFAQIFEYIEKYPENSEEKMIYIDSSRVEKVTESTLMYLFAIISDVKCTNYDVVGNHSIIKDVKRIYKTCGFDKLLSKKDSSYNVYDNGNLILARGTKVDTVVAHDVCQFLKDKLDIDTTEFYGALIELMTNTVQHAYDIDDKLEKKWQIFARYEGCRVSFVFLDTGKGIPATVRKTKSEKLKELFPVIIKMVGEGDILKSAFEGEFRTSTEEKNRGKGLPQIYRLMKSNEVKEAYIFSGRGSGIVRIEENGHNNKETAYNSWEKELYGTLYEFTIKGV